MSEKHTIIRSVFLIIGLAAAQLALIPGANVSVVFAQTSFADNFEASTIDPFWTVFQQFGTISLSSDQARSGSQSVKMSSTAGGQRSMSLTHDFPTAAKGVISVWLYDAHAGSQTLYADLNGFNSAIPFGSPGYHFVVGVRDFDASFYHVGAGGIGEITTPVPRTVGWHEFRLVYNIADVQAYVEGTLVATIPGDFAFDRVFISVSGPSFRPNATFYFDDFAVEHRGPRPTITVRIDIKPGSDPNSINPRSTGTIPVAILSEPTLNAPGEVDTSSLTFGHTGNEESLVFCSPSPEDVNGDGLLDLVCHFDTQLAAFQLGDTKGILRGQLLDGTPIEGSDSVRIVRGGGSGANAA